MSWFEELDASDQLLVLLMGGGFGTVIVCVGMAWTFEMTRLVMGVCP